MKGVKMKIDITKFPLEKIKGEFESHMNDLYKCGFIDYSVYSKLFDVGTSLITKAYELGKKQGGNELKLLIQALVYEINQIWDINEIDEDVRKCVEEVERELAE
jgi:hypothetical protein